MTPPPTPDDPSVPRSPQPSGPAVEGVPALPRPLRVAQLVVVAEAVGYALLGVVQFAEWIVIGERVAMNLTVTAFFLLWSLALAVCGRGLAQLHSWARSPVVLAQLVQLGVAWSFRGSQTWTVSVLLAVSAVIVLVGIFHPASLATMAAQEERDD